MIDGLPICNNYLFKEWFDTGFENGWYRAWLHRKDCIDFPCKHLDGIRLTVDRLQQEVEWKLVMTSLGALAGFTLGLEPGSLESLAEENPE
jgi:hypothetical protein